MSIREQKTDSTVPPPVAVKSRRPRRAVWAVAAIVVLVAGWAVIRSRSNNAASDVTYEFGEVTRGDVRSSVSATGTIQPWKVVDIKSNVAGRIDVLAVDLGDRVRAGQLIAISMRLPGSSCRSQRNSTPPLLMSIVVPAPCSCARRLPLMR